MNQPTKGLVLTACLWTFGAASSAEAAAPAPPPAPAGTVSGSTPPIDPTARARELFKEGVRLARKNDWQAAYAAFLQAWELRQNAPIALNLGYAEKMLGKHRDASEHLRFCIDNSPPDHPDVQLAREWLAESKKQVATLTITVQETGAEVSIDGRPIGTAPLPPEVYVDPGTHKLEARLGTRRAALTEEHRAGVTHEIKLLLREPPPPVVPVPSPPSAAPAAPPEAVVSARTVVLISGGAVALAGVGLGIAGFLVASAKRDERDAFCENAEDKCLTPRSVDPQLYDMQKATWVRLDSERITFTGMAIGSLIFAAVAAAGTGATFFLWKPPPTGSSALQGITVVPAGAGALLKASW